jgi:hypothetical protein
MMSDGQSSPHCQTHKCVMRHAKHSAAAAPEPSRNRRKERIVNKVDELKQVVEQLGVDLAELSAAEGELSNWYSYDLRRSDGSARQDALHEEHGREAENRVSQAKKRVESQKKLVSSLVNAL